MKNEKKAITEQEIQQALKKFAAGGGLIRRLPAQEEPARVLVGARHPAFENLFETVGFSLL